MIQFEDKWAALKVGDCVRSKRNSFMYGDPAHGQTFTAGKVYEVRSLEQHSMDIEISVIDDNSQVHYLSGRYLRTKFKIV